MKEIESGDERPQQNLNRIVQVQAITTVLRPTFEEYISAFIDQEEAIINIKAFGPKGEGSQQVQVSGIMSEYSQVIFSL